MKGEGKCEDKRLNKKNVSIVTILTCLIFAVFLISLNTGTFKIPPMDVLKSLVGLGAEDQSVILFEFRMPRMVIAILVGSALAVSGAIMQGLSRNPLADPGIIGINAGAGLTVVVFVYFFLEKWELVPFYPYLSFHFSLWWVQYWQRLLFMH